MFVTNAVTDARLLSTFVPQSVLTVAFGAGGFDSLLRPESSLIDRESSLLSLEGNRVATTGTS